MTLEGTKPLKILLRNTQPLLGDRLMFTPAVRDLKAARPHWQIGVVSAGPEVWLNNPHIDPAVTEHNCDHLFDIGPGDVTRGSKTNGLHAMQAFFTSLQKHLFGRDLIDVPLAYGVIRADLHLSEAEKNLRAVDGRYWVINCDTGPFTAKRWPEIRFQQLVESLPDLTFVQVGLAKDNRIRLKGDNVIDMIDRTKIRELFSLVHHAEGCISLVSSLMHVAGAFEKPCVVVAGGREPDTFERYPNHRFLDTVGALPCCCKTACWHNALSACKDHDGQHARCQRLIEVDTVRGAVRSYYAGGALEAPPTVTAHRRPVLRFVANAKCLGGAERSVAEIAMMFIEKNWLVEFTSPTANPSPEVLAAMPGVRVTQHVTRPCDVLLLYASDMVFNFDQEKFKVFERIEAKRKVMALTYKIGKTPDTAWAAGWDRYLFLSSSLRDGFLGRTDLPAEQSVVLAPPVDLEPFLAVEPEYAGPVRLVRHSSQGDKKYPEDLAAILRETPEVLYHFKPGPLCGEDGSPSQLLWNCDNAEFYPYDSRSEYVTKFLALGNCFCYLLPGGYTDQGPRVIVEAMAAGLPVIAENRDGAADRVTPQTGWLLDSHDEASELINSLTREVLEEKGKAARARAKSEFDKWKWFENIRGTIG
jgi:ADP-heptose:LPS heptosyltransferase/glycosyltransferase involved in cell wall biosynthesis